MNDWIVVLALLAGTGMGWIIGYMDACSRCMWHRAGGRISPDTCSSCRWRRTRKRR